MCSIMDKTVCIEVSSSTRDTSDVNAYDGGNSGDFEFKPHGRASYNPDLSSLKPSVISILFFGNLDKALVCIFLEKIIPSFCLVLITFCEV